MDVKDLWSQEFTLTEFKWGRSGDSLPFDLASQVMDGLARVNSKHSRNSI